jgi:cytochrome c5
VTRALLAAAGFLLAVCPGAAVSQEKVTAAAQEDISTTIFPQGPERALVVRACAACHAPELVVAKHHTPEEWDDIIAKMVDRGAVANEDEQQRILDYLLRFYGS